MTFMRKSSRRLFLQRCTEWAAHLSFISALIPVASAFAKPAASKKEKDASKNSSTGKKDDLPPLPAGQNAVSETDPTAASLGYKHRVKDIDYVKYPDRKKPENKNNFCNNCQLYSTVNEGWGKCQVIQNGLVHTKGWCAAFNPHPK